MLWTIPALIALMEPAVPGELVGERAWQRLRALRLGLPCLSIGCLECRLEEHGSRVDFSACISATHGGREALRRSLEAPPPARTDEFPGWEPVLRVLRAWVDEGSALFAAGLFAWLEFDLDDTLRDPAPFALLRLADRDALERLDLTPMRAVSEAAALMLQRTPSPGTRSVLTRCYEALPPAAEFLHVSAMPMRDSDAVRLIVSIQARHVPRYLQAVGWNGSIDAVWPILNCAGRFAPYLGLHIDVREEVLGAVGLDVFRGTSPLEDPGWKPLFDLLEESGACTAEKRRALSRWPGRGAAGPGPFAHQKYLELKLVVGDAGSLLAKAYLGFRPEWGIASEADPPDWAAYAPTSPAPQPGA